ncbi:MAG: LEA type 2 family protein [Adhaeribacter sp.]
MNTKKIIIPLIILAVLAAVVYGVVNFKKSDKKIVDYVVPELKLAQIQVTNLTAEKADMKMNMLLDNPGPVGFSLDSLFYTVSIEGNEIARTTYPDSLRLEARDSTTVELPLTIYHDKLADLLKRLEQEGRDSATYAINATIFTDMALIPKDKLNMKIEKRLPVIRIPEIKVTDIKMKDVGLRGATMVVETSIKNKNVYPMRFTDMNYRVQVDNNGWMEGSKPGTINIPAKSTAPLTIPLEIKLKEMGKNALDLIRKGTDVHYDLRMNTKLASDAQVLKESKISLTSSGKLKTVVDAVKENARD